MDMPFVRTAGGCVPEPSGMLMTRETKYILCRCGKPTESATSAVIDTKSIFVIVA